MTLMENYRKHRLWILRGRIGSTETVEDEDYPPSAFTRYWRTYRPWGHAAIWLLVTAYSPKLLLD